MRGVVLLLQAAVLGLCVAATQSTQSLLPQTGHKEQGALRTVQGLGEDGLGSSAPLQLGHAGPLQVQGERVEDVVLQKRSLPTPPLEHDAPHGEASSPVDEGTPAFADYSGQPVRGMAAFSTQVQGAHELLTAAHNAVSGDAASRVEAEASLTTRKPQDAIRGVSGGEVTPVGSSRILNHEAGAEDSATPPPPEAVLDTDLTLLLVGLAVTLLALLAGGSYLDAVQEPAFLTHLAADAEVAFLKRAALLTGSHLHTAAFLSNVGDVMLPTEGDLPPPLCPRPCGIGAQSPVWVRAFAARVSAAFRGASLQEESEPEDGCTTGTGRARFAALGSDSFTTVSPVPWVTAEVDRARFRRDSAAFSFPTASSASPSPPLPTP